MKTRLEKINFIAWFVAIYSVLLIIGLNLFGKALVGIDVWIIKKIFGNIINYNTIMFVPECSGVVAVSAYLAIVLSLIILKYKLKWKCIVGFVLLLEFWNLVRIVIVIYSEKVSFLLAQVTHVIFWFITGIIIILLTIKSIKKNKKK